MDTVKKCRTCRFRGAPPSHASCRPCLAASGKDNFPRWELHPDDVVPAESPKASPLDVQVGGSHYKDMPIQPLVYVMENGLPFAEGSVVKYVSRWRKKGGVADLKKARHLLDVLIEHEEAKKQPA